MIRTGQNRSSAVMQQRTEPADSLDYFPTPPWATRALCEHLREAGMPIGGSAWDPACGEGHMVRPLTEYFAVVDGSDIHDYGAGFPVGDFLLDALLGRWSPPQPADWIITNPPFNKAHEFAALGLALATQGTALLVRTSFLEGIARWRNLFRPLPPARICQFTERVPMFKGRLDPKGSSATSYCWVVWTHAAIEQGAPPAFAWLPPSRERLQKPEDWR